MKNLFDYNCNETMLPPSLINCDEETYQRVHGKPVSKRLIKKISEFFSMIMFGRLIISKREDGSYWVIDGEHRRLGALERGLSDVPVIVIEGLSITEEAELYSMLQNERMAMRPMDIYKSDFARCEPVAHKCFDMVTSTGHKIASGGGDKSVKFYRLLADSVRMDEDAALVAWYSTVALANDSKPSGYTYSVLFDLEVRLRAKGSTLDQQWLQSKLRRTSQAEFLDAVRGATARAGRQPIKVIASAQDFINKGRSVNRIEALG